ncbi:PIN domain-containing protein [Brevundimonas sp. SORGH_AS_0993]|uniref:PIN domain-containing protein n=1 Tax=Brevundimonas sp. SORGH_AS_0993 TaxID=3041794 RepID=UPI002787F303|nr:PIN domain-containing protein [Brevundimonas sp. SORGH_AS_0993]MDQ1155095.1 putative nucleic acid-binding protein [Brevundimonas sp. SORGH_AS_0993]
MIASAEAFLDTNVLIYAALGSADEPAKHERAVELLTTRFGTSGQVLAEFYVTAQQSGSRPLTTDEAREWVSHLSKKPFQPLDYKVVRQGIEYSRRYQISYWDGAVIAAAERLGAKVVYSEALCHGQTYGSVRVENPFLPA